MPGQSNQEFGASALRYILAGQKPSLLTSVSFDAFRDAFSEKYFQPIKCQPGFCLNNTHYLYFQWLTWSRLNVRRQRLILCRLVILKPKRFLLRPGHIQTGANGSQCSGVGTGSLSAPRRWVLSK